LLVRIWFSISNWLRSSLNDSIAERSHVILGYRFRTSALMSRGMEDTTVEISICYFFWTLMRSIGFSVTVVEALQKRVARPILSFVVDIIRDKGVSQAFNFIGRVDSENVVDIRARVQRVLAL